MYFYCLAVAFAVLMQKDANAAEMLDEAMLLSSAGGGEDFEFVENSVLAQGSWAKYRIAKDGVYKLTHAQLSSAGILSGSVPSDKVGVFGFGAYALGFSTGIERPGDILEQPIKMVDGGDGTFDSGDYFLFYADGPDRIEYSNGSFSRSRNTFDRYSYYFVSSTEGSGKRIETQEAVDPNLVSYQQESYTFLSFHENDLVNVGKTGRRLYGEAFEFVRNQNFSLSSATPVSGSTAKITVAVGSASRGGISNFKVTVGGANYNIGLPNIGSSQYTLASRATQTFNIQPSGSSIPVSLELEKGGDDVKAWLDYLMFQCATRDILPKGEVYHISINGTDSVFKRVSGFLNSGSDYWLVDKWGSPCQLNVQNNNGNLSLLIPANKLGRIVEVQGTNYPSPSFTGKVNNQNLHSIAGQDYIIIYPKVFEVPAKRLADFHRSRGLSVRTVLVSDIYNEFQSGSRHVIGIRDFLRHVYVKDPSKLKYALLFGDGSHYNLDGVEGNTNFLPTYQSLQSEFELQTFVSDDFFGQLEMDEGAPESNEEPGYIPIDDGDMDIAIGRFPVSNLTQANNVVDKVIRYMTGPPEDVFGDWRNVMTFVSDDTDGNGSGQEKFHLEDANTLTDWIISRYPGFNVQKVFSDAYKQESTPGGSRYPAVNKIIKDRVQDGALIVNYTGHGGEVGWAHERILDIATINSWTNRYRMPVMVTATCEFSKFDDYTRTSAGELCLLNPNGGAIALLTTTRVVYANPNFEINLDFVQNLFKWYDLGGVVRLGDVYRDTKRQYVNSSGGINHLNFSLLGDPALELAMPRNQVVTTKINDKEFSSFSDTISALSLVKLEGEVRDFQGSPLSDFNGEVDVQVLDKAVTIRSLGNDFPDVQLPFQVRNSLIYKGKATVEAGKFTVRFIVPRDIQLKEGTGLIRYYAHSDETDANGGESELMVGGISDAAIADDLGPDIRLYLNDLDFFSGDVTGENSTILAFLSDTSGINTTGTGIGHDIVAYLDNDLQNGIVLNDFYVADKDSYQSGSLSYPLDGVASGTHRLTLRAWDNNNNPSERSIEFLVRNSGDPFVEELLSYPNPATSHVDIRFTHNQGGYATSALLEIYDMQGRLVANRKWEVSNQEKGRAEYRWDLKNNNQSTIIPGTYVYRVTLENNEGKTASMSNRMLIVR